MQYKRISISDWRQFRNVSIDLHPNLTILTGPNGSGKSTLLSVLTISMQPQNPEVFLATPVNDTDTGRSGFSLSTLFSKYNPFKTKQPVPNHHEIGTLEYKNGQLSKILANQSNNVEYQLSIQQMQPVRGFKIASHRALPRYQKVQSLPVAGLKPKEAFEYFSQSQMFYQRGDRFQREGKFVQNPVAPLKETLIGFAAFGADTRHLKAVPELVGLYDKFQNLLSDVLPVEVGFERLEVRGPEIVVIASTGEFPIDSASGGLMSLIQTTWQIFLYLEAHGSDSVIIIDEPENHLHPSLQRDFLGNLVKAFPSVQFVVATHSPFVITSVKESSVYALYYSKLDDDDGKHRSVVSAKEIDLSSKAQTADKILDAVLGVSITIPIWVEAELDRIANKFEQSEISEASIASLRAELANAGLSEFLPEAIGRIASD